MNKREFLTKLALIGLSPLVAKLNAILPEELRVDKMDKVIRKHGEIEIINHGSREGDFLIAAVAGKRNDSDVFYSPPVGWTEVSHHIDESDNEVMVAYKVADRNEPESYKWATSDYVTGMGIIYRVDGYEMNKYASPHKHLIWKQ